MVKIQTFSIIAGSEACNASCPFCISKMTLPLGVTPTREPEVNWRNFDIACKLAKQCGVTTAMFTGKGEPTIFPAQITKFLKAMLPFNFPLVELQTNGILIATKTDEYRDHLQRWYQWGMTTIAVSIVHYDPEMNRKVYLPRKDSYIDLLQLIKILHDFSFSVRLTCIAADGFIDGKEKLMHLINFAKENNVEQLTLTPVNKPNEEESRNREAWEWTGNHHLKPEQLKDINDYVTSNGALLWKLVHGAQVFDLHGQNLCLNNCLSIQETLDEMRNIIFFPDGHIRGYWQYPGSIIL